MQLLFLALNALSLYSNPVGFMDCGGCCLPGIARYGQPGAGMNIETNVCTSQDSSTPQICHDSHCKY